MFYLTIPFPIPLLIFLVCLAGWGITSYALGKGESGFFPDIGNLIGQMIAFFGWIILFLISIICWLFLG